MNRLDDRDDRKDEQYQSPDDGDDANDDCAGGHSECTTDAFTIINGSLMTGFTGHADIEASRRCRFIGNGRGPTGSFFRRMMRMRLYNQSEIS